VPPYPAWGRPSLPPTLTERTFIAPAVEPILTTMIVYWFLVTSVPEGGAPIEIRRQWVDLALPVRRPRPVEGPQPYRGRDVIDRRIRRTISDGVPVELADALALLRMFGREEAAAWWDELLAADRAPTALVFRAWEGRVVPDRYARMLYPELDGFD
jgi:hypothetical protein